MNSKIHMFAHHKLTENIFIVMIVNAWQSY